MSILPLLMEFANDPLGETFGYRLHPGQFTRRVQPSWMSPRVYSRHWSVPTMYERNKQPATINKSNIGKDGFQVCMDVKHFAPNEITVKTVDNSVVVEAKHEEKEDEHGHIYRHFVRRYELPQEFDVRDVISALSSDGLLTIKAPPKATPIESNERVIQIQQTGPAYLSVKQNEPEQKKADEKI